MDKVGRYLNFQLSEDIACLQKVMRWFPIGSLMIFAYFERGLSGPRNRCDIMHYEQCCNPLIYNKCFQKCHHWAAINCYRGRVQRDQIATNSDVTKGSVIVPAAREKDRNEISSEMEATNAEAECGTLDAEFAACVPKEIADQIFYDCCKLYVEAECHELCRYEINRDVAQSLLLDTIRDKKCTVNNIPAVLYCASQNRDNRLCCRQFGLASPELGVGRRCLRMCDPYRFDIPVLQENDLVCLGNWDIIMYCHHGGLRY